MDNLKLKRFIFFLILIFVLPVIRTNAEGVDSIRIDIGNILRAQENRSQKTNINPAHYMTETDKIDQLILYGNKYKNSNTDSLLFYSQKAIKSSLKLADLDCISRSVQMYGDYFLRKEDFTKAGECYLMSLKIEEKIKNRKRAADLNDELGIIYYHQEIFGKSLSYYSEALTEYEREQDTLKSARVYSHIGNLFSSREFCEQRTKEQKREDFNTAIRYYEKSILLSEQKVNKSMVINGYANIAAVYNKLEQSGKALPYLIDAVDYYRDKKDIGSLTSILHILGVTYYKLKQYSNSTKSFEEALKISLDNNSMDGIQYLYESMAQTFSSAKDYKNANEYYIRYMTVKDSVNNLQKTKELFELETKYQSEKKENEIIKLTALKREKNLLLYFLSGLIQLLLVLGYFIVKNIGNKKLIAEQTIEIKEQHILELENERRLIATKSVLKGEESERSRMARDLHDGLGGLLSGVKINLSSMKGNSVISNENADSFDQAIRLLDNAITELRRVAHSLMPETLNHYGLKTAFNDFISELNLNASYLLSFRFSGEDIRYNSQLELTLYRIAQELVNNALKHSGAKNIDLQLIAETNRVCIQVVDNGRGFNVSDKYHNGKGLISIRDRVASNNGRFDLESSTGNGTEATVELFI